MDSSASSRKLSVSTSSSSANAKAGAGGRMSSARSPRVTPAAAAGAHDTIDPQQQVDLMSKPRPRLNEVTVPENVRFRTMELRDAAAVFHLGEEVFNVDSFPQLYRTWDSFEVLEMVGELCIIAEEILEQPASSAEEGKAATTGEAVMKTDSSSSSSSNGNHHQNSRIVGFIFGSITEKRKKESSCGLLGWIGVAPSHQRRNIGTVLAYKLFNLFIEEDINLIIADTPMENTPAIGFLHRMGFATPVYHVYMSLNLAKKAAQQQQQQSAVTLPPEAKAIKIRPMTIDDLVAVHDLGERIYDPHLYPNLYRIWSESEVVELFGSDSEFCQVAELDGKVVGFVMGTTINKRRSSWVYSYLIWLGISPEVQRYGVGRRLFNAFHDLTVEDGCRIMMIDTQADNIPAVKFFQRAGFGSKESHVYFSKTLGPEDAIASEERVVRQSSLPSANGSKKPGFKVTRLIRFKRAHALHSFHELERGHLMGRQAQLLGEEEAQKKPAAPAVAAAGNQPQKKKEEEEEELVGARHKGRTAAQRSSPKESRKRAKRGSK